MFILFIVVSFHHQSEVIFSITINGKQIFDCKVTFLFTKKADTILLILSIILILVIFLINPDKY